MSKMGRPPKPGDAETYQVTITLREEEHPPWLLEWFRNLPPKNRAKYIVQALIQGRSVHSRSQDVEQSETEKLFDNILGTMM